jgi:uncharacterized protein
MIDLQAAEGGVIVPVRAQPKACRNSIVGTHAGRLRITVTEPPEKGKANKALGEILAAALEIAPSRVQLIAGATSAQKKFLVAGLSLEVVRERLIAALPSETQ